MDIRLTPSEITKLEDIVKQELAGYEAYLTLLVREQKSVVTLQADEVSKFSERRSQIIDQLAKLRDERISLVSSLSGSAETPLSEFLEHACEANEKKRLLGLIAELKAKVAEVERKSAEFNQIVNFSLGLVSGEISLLWSASQSVAKVYNSFGALTETSQPAAPRVGSLLGEA